MRADAHRNREKILASADALFASVGLDAPLDDVARQAGVGPGTLHRHFPTKHGLIAAVLDRRLTDLLEQIEARRSPPAAALRELLERLMDDGLRNRALKEALAAAGVPFSTEAAARLRRLIAGLIRAGHRDATLRPGLATDDVLALLAAGLAAQDQLSARPSRIKPVRAWVLDALRAP